MYRKTYAKINGLTIEKNVKEIKNKYNNYEYYIGVVKNNAYSHGIKTIKNMIRGGINYLAVSSLEEALEIRKISNDIPILVLEPIDTSFIDDCLSNKITITVESLDYLKNLNKIALAYPLTIHLKIDTGMNRLGFKDKEQLESAISIIDKNKSLYLEGIYTHFLSSGVSDVYYDKQINIFKELTSGIDLSKIPIVHCDRSITFVHHEKIPFVNALRLGIVMYGFNDNRVSDNSFKGHLRELKRNLYIKKNNISPAILENDLHLKTAFSLYSEVMSIRKAKKGEVVGYNGTYKVKNDSFIATIPIGYADGVTKDFSYVYIKNKRYQIIADSMDMIMVLVSSDIKIKDKVEIFGDNISIREVLNNIHTNAYHLFNQISNRVLRLHIDKDEEVEIKY